MALPLTLDRGVPSPKLPAVAFECILRFDTDDARFARGFEAGRVWALLCINPDAEVEEVVHATNVEMFLRMGEALERRVIADDHRDD